MKKYRVKIDCPAFTKGKIYELSEQGRVVSDYYESVNPTRYPDIFQEIKEPIFVTADGVELFDENDKIYCIDFDLSTCFFTIKLRELLMTDIKTVFFSTREAAETYIDQNKPIFSKKQVLDAIKKADNHRYLEIEHLKNELGL